MMAVGCFLLTLAAEAQTEGVEIFFGRGLDFALTSGGVRRLIYVSDLAGNPEYLSASDSLHTGQGTTIEIRETLSGSDMTVLENTSLLYTGHDDTGGFIDFNLLYGQVEAIPGRTADLVIRAGRTSIRVAQGETVCRYVVDPALGPSQPVLTVQVKTGRADVYPYLPGRSTEEVLAVNAGETLTLEMNGASV
jgi:hypothetical protein